MARSVSVNFQNNPASKTRFSYVVPPGDEPGVGDYILVTISDNASEVTQGFKVVTILAVEDPAHPKATKMYFSRMMAEHVQTIQAANNMRVALSKDLNK